MTENYQNLLREISVGEGREAKRREAAVTAALTLIHAKAVSTEGVNLEYELDNLSGYADTIQAALDKK